MHSALSTLGRRTAEPAISWLMQTTLSRPDLVSLAAGFTDNPSLPLLETREIVDELLASPKSGQAALQYGSTSGDPELCEQTATRLNRLDRPAGGAPGITAGNLIITHGSQQLLYLTLEALCDPGDIVIVEDPTYFVFLGITQSHGVHCRGVQLSPDGVDLADLERVLEGLKQAGDLPRLKALYLVTYHQNPSGRTTTLERKQAALKLLKRYEKTAGHRLYLIEDAAYRELRFAGDDIPSALTCDAAGDRVIYAGTYSKPFATGIRAGFGVLPEPLLTAVRRIKGNHDFGTVNFAQRILARALTTGRFDRHLTALQQRYARKSARMVAAIRRYFPATVEWEVPTGGLYVWASLPARQRTGRTSRCFKASLERGVLYVPGGLCYADDPSRPLPDHQMRLSFGGASETAITTGIERLGSVLQELSR